MYLTSESSCQMRFRDPIQEREFLAEDWNSNRYIIPIFAVLILLHTIYLIVITFTITAVVTQYVLILLFGMVVPVTITIIILVFVRPFRRRWTTIAWYTAITIASIMVTFFISSRTLLCHYGFEPPDSCVVQNRPVLNSSYASIYILLGPLLVLTIFNNRLSYQIPAILLALLLYIWVSVVTTDPNNTQQVVLMYTGFGFVIGAQGMALLVSRSRQQSQRERYLSDIRRNQAEAKARDEEKKRTQFTNMLFHEIRIPLNNVILSLNDIETDEDFQRIVPAHIQESLERISVGLHDMIVIINDSLDFRKMSEGKLQIVSMPFDYHKTVRDVVRSMNSHWRNKNIRFSLELDPAIDALPYLLSGDPARLRQVLANYLSNAAKFTPSNGAITLKTAIQSARQPERTVVYEIYTHVKDTGIGIKPEDQAKLFKPFVQIDPEQNQQGKGSGLGLSICAGIINSMKGEYGVTSELGNGSTFWFTVPLPLTDVPKSADTDSNGNASQVDSSDQRQKTLKILVTDDDQATRRIMRKLMEKMNHNVDEAENGQQCVQMVLESIRQQRPYDVIFIDNMMPIMSGNEAIRVLQENSVKIPIVVLTGSSDTHEIKELEQSGAFKVLVKPATLRILQDVLKDIVYQFYTPNPSVT